MSPSIAPALLHLHFHFHLHHQFRGPPFDYVGLAAAAAASWIGLPGPGEPLLIAAGVLSARHKLDLTSVLVVAWAAATAGGVAGWAVGLVAGRALLTGPGPLRGMRRRMLTRGEAVFESHPVVAILLTPAFVAGALRVRPLVYQVTNVVSALVWTLGLGVGAYLVGPAVLDVFGDIGTASTVVVVALIVLGVGLELRRRRTRRVDGP